MGKLGYLLHHRGHTHTVVFALAAALLLWGIAMLVRPTLRAPASRMPLLVLAVVGTLSHLALDYTNSYGVHPFWPFNSSWFYGDAVFIVEPWLWVVALIPLVFVYRSRGARVLLGALLAIILAASWSVDLVARWVAIALTVVAIAWMLIMRVTPLARRAAYGLLAWCVVEAGFFASSHVARTLVRKTVGDTTLRDAVLSPAVGDPFCYRALVVELDDGEYRVSAATVAPFARLRDVSACTASAGGRGAIAGDSTATLRRVSDRHVRWEGQWSAPASELVALAHSRCEIAAALQFVRVPIWRTLPDGTLRLADLRFGEGDGFSTIDVPPASEPCPTAVPGWRPPRRDIIGAAVAGSE